MKKESLEIGKIYSLKDLTEDLFYAHIKILSDGDELVVYKPRVDNDLRYLLKMVGKEDFELHDIVKKGHVLEH